MVLRRTFAKLTISTALVLGVSALPSLKTARMAESLPSRVGDDAFWRMVSGFSEEGGYFRFENFLSNELGFQHVVDFGRTTTSSGERVIALSMRLNS